MSTNTHNEDKSHADVGIVYALPIELAPLADQLTRLRKVAGKGFVVRGGLWGERRIALVESGVGQKRSARATEALLEGHKPDWVLAAGFAGATAPSLAIADIVMADRVIGADGKRLEMGVRIPRSEIDKTPGVHVGAILTVDRLVRTAKEKRALYEETGAMAVDMETAAVARVCHERKVRCLAIRVISDTADHDLPPEAESVLGSSRFYRVGAAVGALWRRPQSYKDLWRLREQAHRAADRLAQFLGGIIDQLD